MSGGVFLKAAETTAAHVEKVAKLSEVCIKEIGKDVEVAPVDIDMIKSQSLESIIESNAEKATINNEIISTEFRFLSESDVKHIQELTGMSDATIKDCTINNDGLVHLKCINEGKVGELSEVPYVEKIVDINGIQLKVVVPEFPNSFFECNLPKEMLLSSDKTQFEYCTEQLKAAIEKSPELAKKFSMQQLDQIMDGAPRVSGLTWHHCAESGRMQLVPTITHTTFRHTGGKAIWGGGRN